MTELTACQSREIEHHRGHATEHASAAEAPVPVDIITEDRRRWWNAYWHLYSSLRREDWRGKKVLVPGAGFGEDAIRLAHMGAEVEAFDISPEIVDIARVRCAKFGYRGITFGVMPSEAMTYPDNTFDAVFFHDILHHVDIPRTMSEVRRVLKPGGRLIGIELYTHSGIERAVRKSYPVEKILYPLLQRFVYGSEKPYITEDEHKIDEREFAVIYDMMQDRRLDYFDIVVGRLVPNDGGLLSRADRLLARALGRLSWFLAGRILFFGTVRK